MTLQGFRLSPQQRRAWQTHQDGAACASQSLVRLEGELDVPALAAALAEVVGRHEILRTSFQRVPGLKMPLQMVTEPAPVVLAQIDLAHHAAADQEAEIERFLELDRRRPCDLAAGRPLRAALLRLGERSHRLLLTLAPVCADSVTLCNLVREIARGYAGADGPSPTFIQYADFAEWQNDWLAGGETDEGKDHWQRQGLLHLVETAASPFAPEALSLALAPEETRAAEELARRQGATLPAVLLASWQSLLSRMTGRSDLVVGTVLDGRSYAEISDALGSFARTLPVACTAGGRAFQDLVQQIGAALEEAEAWQDYFVADEAIPGGTAGELRFVPYAFELVQIPEPIAASGLRLTIDRVLHGSERFALRLVCSLRGETITAELQYDSQRFRREEAARIAGRWRRLFGALLAEPEREAADVDILEPDERRWLVEEWNRTEAPFPSELGIHQLIEIQAVARPDAPALLLGERVVTYGELDRRADRLARRLVDLGVRPGDLVAVGFDRTPETVAGVLAVLKAGAAYVPLDPEQPPARLRYLLEETSPSAVLLPRAFDARVPAHPVRIFLEDEPALSASGLPGVDPRGLAYVVFTSGSTGRPKGVLASHLGVVNYITFLRTEYGLGEADVVLQIPDLTFDSSVRDLLGPLAAGARVALVERDRARDARTLLRKIPEHGVTCLLSVVPTMLRALLEAASDNPVPHGFVRLVLASGEVLRAADAAGVERVFGPGARLFNQYGPTECTMTSSFHPVPPRQQADDGSALPIGRPIPNARFYLLDGRMLPVPTGSPGELYIGGAGLANGYLNAPDLTAERFVADPFAGAPGARLYRTGDLAVHRPDGALDFRGRIDQQVKVRGVRVEPEEVEAALLEYPAVQRAVVVAREDAPGEVRLCAYLVASRGVPLSADPLRIFLRGRLPEAMIPSAFVILESLPLTPNGKVDRRSLPAPGPATPEREVLGREAPTPTEEIIAGIWADVLNVREIGLRSDFFSLGGHSLLSTQVVLRINEAFGLSIPLRTLFDTPTVEGLGRVVEEAVLSQQGMKAPPLCPVPRDAALPLSFAQQRLWFLDQLLPGNPLFNLGSALRLRGPLDLEVLQRTLDEMIRRHETLRTRFAGTDRGPVQVIDPPRPAVLETIDLSDREPEARKAEAARLMAAAARRPFDLDRGPLFRVLVIRQEETDHLLALGLHHIVSDAWSAGVLFRELAVLFDAFARGESSPLPDLPLQYADFAVWQREWLQGAVLEGHLDFWKERLAGAPPVLDLPFDRPRAATPAFQGARHLVELPSDLARELARLGRGEGATTFMILLAALDVTLRHLGAGDDIVVGADVANRTRTETEGLIGFFINQVVLRADLSGDPTFRELLAQVRRVAMDAYAHQDLPFDKLVEALNPERNLSYGPIFQVKLVLQNTPRSQVELPSGLTVERVPVESTQAREDLLLNVSESGEGLSVHFKYNAALFDAQTIVRAAELFAATLRHVAVVPGASLSELDKVLAEADRASWASQAQKHASLLEQRLKTVRRRATSL